MTITNPSAGLWLALSTSSPALSMALGDGEQLVARDHRLIGRGHAEALMPAVAALLAGRRPERILIDVGPGSYTGIRIGIAAARALGLAWGVPVAGISALSLVAAQAFADDPGLAKVTALIDAGRGRAAGAIVGHDLVARDVQLLDLVPADIAVAGAGAALVPGAAEPRHAGHPDAAWAGRLPAAALGPPAALYVAD